LIEWSKPFGVLTLLVWQLVSYQPEKIFLLQSRKYLLWQT